MANIRYIKNLVLIRCPQRLAWNDEGVFWRVAHVQSVDVRLRTRHPKLAPDNCIVSAHIGCLRPNTGLQQSRLMVSRLPHLLCVTSARFGAQGRLYTNPIGYGIPGPADPI